jgi:hypothetical protein
MQFPRMLIDAVLRAARILQAIPGSSMPLVRLHAQLVRELGPAVGSYGEIYQQLKKRTDSFIVVDEARVLAGADGWPGVVREAYDSALEHAGLGSCARISLTSAQDGEPSCELLTALAATLADLTNGAAGDETMSEYLERAGQQLAELNRTIISGGTDRPTTPLPDLPPSR